MTGTPRVAVTGAVAAAALGALAAAACQDGLDAPAPPPALDAAYFRCQVQPVLAARCAFPACHGNEERPFRVYAVARYRLSVPWTAKDTPLLASELAANQTRALGFATAGDQGVLLLDKPLDTRAGGRWHGGQDRFGGDDVFVTRDDPGYVALAAWIAGATADAACVPTEDVGP